MALGFLRLDNRYILEMPLKPEGGLHIGSGRESPKTDAAFLCDERGPIVPGSSLRGAMRSTLERIVQAVAPDRGCVLFGPPECHPTCFTVRSKECEDFRKAERDAAKREARLHEKLLLGNGQCDICRLFGSPLLASRVRISDGRLTKGASSVRHGVGIDRDTETAREHIKYDFEVMDSEGINVRMEIENASMRDLALLHILFSEMIHCGLDVGGKKSSGLGRCWLVRDSPDFTVKYFDGPESLRRYLKGRPDDMSAGDFLARLEKSFDESFGKGA